MKYVGSVLFVLGLALMGLSYYTTHRVNQATATAYISAEKINEDPLAILGGPITEGVAEEVKSDAENRIDRKAMPYEQMSANEYALGIILIILGSLIMFFYIARKLYR